MRGKPAPTLDDLYRVAAQLHERSLFAQAEPILRHIAGTGASHAPAHNLLGLIHSARDELPEAVEQAEAAISADPGSVVFQTNLAMVLADSARLPDAETAYRRALELDATHGGAQSGLGQLLMLQDRFHEGTQHYRRLKKPFAFEGSALNFWNGEPLAGKSLLVLRAQGIGEELHAARYYRQLTQVCSFVTVASDPRLMELLSSAAPGLDLISAGDVGQIGKAAAEADYVCYITDLVALLQRPKLDGNAYLFADDGKIRTLLAKYRSEFAGKRLIGISWITSSKLRPAARSIDLEYWAPVLKRSDCQFFSLQYDAEPEFVARTAGALGIDLICEPTVDPKTDISGLAAQIAAMDQIISIDNSTVHLAGALGKPVWTMLTDIPYWMWGLEGTSTDWYPSMRLYRQKTRGDWAPVLKSVERDLTASPAAALQTSKPAEAFLAAIHQEFQRRNYEAALSLLDELSRAHPGHEKVSRWKALCHYRQDRQEEALPWAERAMAEEPENAENHRVLAIIQQGLLEFEEAERTLRTGMKLAPRRADLRSALVMQLLLNGRCDEGWRLFDAVNRAFVVTRLSSGRQWRGERLESQTLHLWALEGLGDYSLALRMLPEIEKRATNLILECDERLIPLLARTETVAELQPLRPRSGDEKLPALGEVQSAEFSAIRHLAPNLNLDGIEAGTLVHDGARATRLRAKYQAEFPGKRLIGLSWYSASVTQGIARSVPPEDLAQLLARRDCQFIDLQYNNPDCPMTDYHLPSGQLYRDETIDSWADIDGLAAQLSALDLTITIDNSTAQIAGAIGAPCWTLLHTLPDWRWGLSGDTCVWYPKTRLFRQTARRDWSAPLAAVNKALDEAVIPKSKAV